MSCHMRYFLYFLVRFCMERVTVSTGPDDAFIDVIDVYFALYADMMINVARINVVQIVIFQ